MLRQLKTISLLGCLAFCAGSSLAFSLLGPNNEPWQTPDIGYNPQPYDPLPVAPKNISEEYRRNTPVLYYTFDANFLEYFGTRGVQSVEAAFQVFNNLTNVSSYSANLNEFPLAVTRENYQAEALYMYDIKSYAMNLIIEQLGLTSPERYVWTLHDRFNVGPAPCPAAMEYLVVKRNWDIVPSPANQLQSSSYVNGTLYSYYILEYCTPPPTAVGEAVEFAVDPLDFSFTAVASSFGSSLVNTFRNSGLLYTGKFYTGLTRDDVGGLRYLLRANNYNWESPGTTTISLTTNAGPQLLVTSNITQLAASARTNSPAALQALYPGLGISYSTNWFVTTWVTNAVPYFTNSPYDPATTAPRLAFATNRTLTIENRFAHVFDNLYVPQFIYGSWQAVLVTNLDMLTNYALTTIQSINVSASASPYAPAAGLALATNVTTRTYATSAAVGEFFLLPTNACEVVLLKPQLTITNFFTNIIAQATNVVAISNATIVTNITEEFTVQTIDYGTTHVFTALSVACTTNAAVIAGGIERIRFERRDYDSLIGRFFQPFTNYYSLSTITNNQVSAMRVFRPVVAPDFLFTAVDAPLTPGPNADPGGLTAFARNIVFSTNSLAFYPGQAGPGTIEGPTLFTFNKGGPIYDNLSPNAYFWDRAEASQFPALVWGSFDGSTNAPVIYPNGETLEALENALFFHISPAVLTEGSLRQPYEDTTFTVTGGTAPYTWSLAPNSPGLPPGMTLSPEGVLTGTPTQRATYDFIIRVTDATGRFADRPYSIKINW